MTMVKSGLVGLALREGHGALPMSLPAARFRAPLGSGFSEKSHVSPLSIMGHCFEGTWWDRDDNGCRTACSTWSGNYTQMSRGTTRGVKSCKSRMIGLQT